MIMRYTKLKCAAKLGLITLTVAGFAIGQEAPAEAPKEAPAAPAADPAAVKPDASYAFGFQMGRQLNGYGIEFDDISVADFNKGFEAAIRGQDPGIEVERLQAAMQAIGEMVQKREADAAQTNLAAGKKFMEENGKKEGVITTKSGLQYEILAKGGEQKYDASKGESKLFMVNYRGTLIDGTEFDKSAEGKPYPMTLQVVPGFKEALTTMPVGAKWKLYLPSELAYGAERQGPQIAPNSALIFELELVEIKDAPEPSGELPFPLPQGQ